MGCCGQSRAAAAARPTLGPRAELAQAYVPPPPAPAPAVPRAVERGTARLRYTASRAVRVRGPETGRLYDFSGQDPVGDVDARDAEGLVRTGFFKRTY